MSKLPQYFIAKKARILRDLSVPVEDYDDLSPKGSVDIGIKELIDEINTLEGCVTTSSCAGRISIFLEGNKEAHAPYKTEQSGSVEFIDKSQGLDKITPSTIAGIGGKGGGGRWLFVSHDPIDQKHFNDDTKWSSLFEMERGELDWEKDQKPSKTGLATQRYSELVRFIHFKFEPMILHVLTASLEQAQVVLSAALQAGFRESGALNLVSSTPDPATPMVGIRSIGLALESLIGVHQDGKNTCTVSEWQLRNLVEISEERFRENTKRIERFRHLLREMMTEKLEIKRKGQEGEQWEDPQVRKERKRAEGLRMKELARREKEEIGRGIGNAVDDGDNRPGMELLDTL